MGHMWRRWLGAGLLVGCLAVGVAAEPVYIIWREPTASGTLSFTTVYWCLGASCVTWQTDPVLQCVSRDGSGGRTKKTILHIPLVENTLPVTVRFKVTATDTSQTETSGVITSHTFSPE